MFGIPIALLAQGGRDKSIYYDLGKRFYCDVYSLPYSNKDSIKTLVMFRFSNNLLTFTKKRNIKSTSEEFNAFPQVEIQFTDSNGIIKKVEIWRDTIISLNFEDTKSNQIFHYGWYSFLLPIGYYTVSAILSDNDNYTLKELKLPPMEKVKFFNGNQISEPIYCIANNDNENVIIPSVLGKGIRFSSDISKLLIPGIFKGEFAKYNYTLEYIEQKIGNIDWNDSLKIEGVVSPELNFSFNIASKSSDKGIFLTLEKDTLPTNLTGNYRFGYLDIDLPADKNVPGTYQLLLWQDNSKDTSKYRFKVIWEDMPYSLRQPDYAIQSMYYILTDKEFSEMNKGNDRKMFRKILDYWRTKDPTPFTVYNEAMTEYFKRVDYSFFNFKTITDPDGSKTDRGKIYILNGKPAKIARSMGTDDIIQEIWNYPNLKKQFVFETDSKSHFNLIKIKDLK